MPRTTTEDLFRRKALDALHERPLGRVICVIPPVWKRITTFLVVAFAAVVVTAPRIEWHRTEAVRGWLVPDAGVVRVINSSNGVVTERFVEIGQSVLAGDVLATISTEQYSASGESRYLRNRKRIQTAIEESYAEERLLGDRFNIRQQKLVERGSLLQTELQSIERQLSFERSRRGIEEQQLSRLDSAGNAVPAWEILRQEESLAARMSAIEALQQKRVRTAREIATLRNDMEAIPVDASLARSEVLKERARLQREIDESSGEISLVAPIAGEVADLELSVGDAVKPGRTLVSILPSGVDLHAELFVPTKSASRLDIGQTVRIFIDAWPREKYGAISGRIDSVAEFVGESSGGRGAGSYRVIVRMDDTDRHLRPGMSLGAELLLERRDLVDLIVGPLRSRFSR